DMAGWAGHLSLTSLSFSARSIPTCDGDRPMRISGVLGAIIPIVSGCIGTESQTAVVAPSPFPSAAASATLARASFAPPTTAVAARVDTIGRNILVANAQTGIRPLF